VYINGLFTLVFCLCLLLFVQPLLETKANERLRVKGVTDIKKFFKALTAFSIDANNELKIEIVHCLRCIINGGKDSLVLRTDVVPAKVRKNKVPITDTSFIQSLVRDCSIIDFIVLEFQNSTDNFEKATSDLAESSMLYSQRSVQLNSRTTGKQQTLRQTLREYGIPEDCNASEECSAEEKGASFETEIITEEGSDEIVKTLPMLKTLKFTVTLQDRLTTDLLELCADLAEDPRNAQIMIAMRMCDGIVKFLELLVKENVRDKRVNSLIELLWTLLDSYLYEERVDQEKDDAQPTSARGEFEYNPHNLSHIIDQATAVSTLHNIITIFAQDGFKHPDKECRNEVLAVLTLLAESPSSHTYFTESGLLNDIVYYACFAECSSLCETFPEWLDQHPQSSSNPRNFGTASEIDLQYKRGLWILISDLLQSDDPSALACVGQSPLLLSLLFYLEYESLPMDNQKSETPEGSPPRGKILSGALEEEFGDVRPSFAESSHVSGLEQLK
jgi:hypothetical protein